MAKSFSDWVLVAGRRIPVDVQVDAHPDPPRVTATAGSLEVRGTLRASAPWLALCPEEGEPIEAAVAPTAHGAWVWVNGRARKVLDAEAPEARQAHGGAEGPGDGLVTPPMPAVVTQVLVAAGDVVDKGDRVAVISAMKMELSLVAPHPGEVTAVRVQVGDKVSPGDVLVDIAPPAAGSGEVPR